MRAPSRALPRRRALCTNWKKPRYSGSFSCEMPRCGRSQEQPGAEQGPRPLHRVDVDLAEAVAVLISRIFTAAVTNRLVLIAPGLQAGVDAVLVGVDERAFGNCGLEDWLDRPLLHVGQHAQDHLPTALDHAEDGRLLLLQRTPARRCLQSAAPAKPPL
jgi:hypothetical protein